MVCDFCNNPDPTWLYECRGGNWAACTVCQSLIEAEATDLMLERMVLYNDTQNYAEVSVVQQVLIGFLANRLRPPQLIQKTRRANE